MANEEIFTGKAKQYSAGRPSYAPEALAMIFDQLVRPGSAVADIGSGTGILSGEFIRRGFHTYCVEPNRSMRQAAEEQYGGSEYFHSVDAGAEHTGLADGSIGLAAAASAFHWLIRNCSGRSAGGFWRRPGMSVF